MTEPDREKFFTRKALYDYLWRIASTVTAAAIIAIYLKLAGVIHGVSIASVLAGLVTVLAAVGIVVTVIAAKTIRRLPGPWRLSEAERRHVEHHDVRLDGPPPKTDDGGPLNG